MKTRRKNTDALTEDEIEFLRSERAASSVRGFVARQHETVGVRTSAYRKVAAAAKAEREAIMEVALLAVTRAAADKVATPADKVAELESEKLRLQREVSAAQVRIAQLTAAPALAIHSEGTGR